MRVVEDKGQWRRLELNEGFITHSKYHPHHVFTFGEWDYFAIAPFFNPAPYDPHERADRWALIGSGAGTTARLIGKLYAPAVIHGVEIDPLVAEVGRKYFGMHVPNFNVTALDGRAWIATTTNTYDVIAIDAYRQPYLPFELATVEFFQLVCDHLAESGVVCINVSEPMRDRRLVNALAATIAEVFPSVYLVPLRKHSNATLVVGTRARTRIEDFRENIAGPPRMVSALTTTAEKRVVAFDAEGQILTDDCAPVERLMHGMVLKAIASRRKAIAGRLKAEG